MFNDQFRFPAALIAGLFVATPEAMPQESPRNRPEAAANRSDLVARMMKFDKDGNGTLAKAEITDPRLVRLFNRADADKDGIVTKGELEALEAKEQSSARDPFDGPGGPGGPGGGFGGPPGGPPRPGDILPEMLRDRLNLTADQQAQIDELQRDVDARMAKILNSAQKAQLKQMRDRGPFGPPSDGGRGGRGGPGGNGFPPQ